VRGFCRAVQLEQGPGQVGVRASVVRLEPYRLPQGLLRLGQPSLIEEGPAQLRRTCRMAGIQPDRLFRFGYAIVHVAPRGRCQS
jgi:hypothetical protein